MSLYPQPHAAAGFVKAPPQQFPRTIFYEPNVALFPYGPGTAQQMGVASIVQPVPDRATTYFLWLSTPSPSSEPPSYFEHQQRIQAQQSQPVHLMQGAS